MPRKLGVLLDVLRRLSRARHSTIRGPGPPLSTRPEMASHCTLRLGLGLLAHLVELQPRD